MSDTAMICPVGLSAAAACAAKRAGISAFAELPLLDNGAEPVVGAAVPGLDWAMPHTDRLVELLRAALEPLLRRHPDLDLRGVPLLVGLAEAGRPGPSAGCADLIQRRVEAALGVRFHAEASRVFATGHVAGFQALRHARILFERRDIAACIVAGVDSLLDDAALLWLDRHQRLKKAARRDGVIPGEAAAAVLLRATATDRSETEIVGLGFGFEAASVTADAPLLGHGLATAARAALAEAGLGLQEMDFRLSDVTGELYGFKELPLLAARLMRTVRREPQPLWHWAEAIGDTGAAAGPAQIVLADQAFRKGYAPGRRAICLASAVAGERAAAVVRSALAPGDSRA